MKYFSGKRLSGLLLLAVCSMPVNAFPTAPAGPYQSIEDDLTMKGQVPDTALSGQEQDSKVQQPPGWHWGATDRAEIINRPAASVAGSTGEGK